MKFILILFYSLWANEILHSMDSEIQRNLKNLTTSNGIKPYFIAVNYWEVETDEIVYEAGNLVSKQNKKEPRIEIELRVGSPKLDNSRFQGNYVFSSRIYAPIGKPTDTLLLKRAIWSLLDEEFKKAAEYYSQKKAWLKDNKSRLFNTNDFRLPKANQKKWTYTFSRLDTAEHYHKIKSLSNNWNKIPNLIEEKTKLAQYRSHLYRVDSQGGKYELKFDENTVSQTVLFQKNNGDLLWNYIRQTDPDPAELDYKKLWYDSEKMKRRMTTIIKQRAPSSYRGPVIFAESAAPGFFEYTLFPSLEDLDFAHNSSAPYFPQLQNRLLFNDNWDIVDSPETKKIKQKNMYGWSPIDHEGQSGGEINIIKQGVLKNMLSGLTIYPFDIDKKAYGRWRFQHPSASVVTVTNHTSYDKHQFEEKFSKKIRKENLNYGIRINKLFDTEAAKALRHPLAEKILALAPTHENGKFNLGAVVEMDIYNNEDKTYSPSIPLHFATFDTKSLRFLSHAMDTLNLRQPFASYSIWAPNFQMDLLDLVPNPGISPQPSIFLNTPNQPPQ